MTLSDIVQLGHRYYTLKVVMKVRRGNVLATLVPVALILSITFALLGSCVNPDIVIPRATGGVLDLSDRDFTQTGPVALDGEWSFFPGQLLEPAAFTGSSGAPAPVLVTLPDEGLWSCVEQDGQPLSIYGCATWRLLVTFPSSNETLALRIPEFFSSARIVLNGKMIFASGVPGETADTTRHWFRTGIVHLEPRSGSNEILLQVANFGERRGGLSRSLWVGTEQDIQNAYIRSLAMDIVIFGSLLAMGLYHLCLFWIRKKDRSALWFGLFCLIISIRSLLYGERFAFELFPGLPWEVFNRLDHLTFYFGVPVFSAYIMLLFNKDVVRLPFYIYQGTGIIFSLFLFFPPAVFNTTVVWYELITAGYVVYILFIIIKALIKKREGAKTTLVGIGIFLCFGINEILFNMGVINTFNSLSIGLVLFLFTQSVLIAMRFSKAFEDSELLGKSLLNLNRSLRRFIPQEFFMILQKRQIEDIQLGDQVEKNMSIMFSDIRRFTLLAEQLGAAKTFDFLNDYYSRIGDVIRSYGGFVDKYLGDGFIALFPESPDSALKTAIGIQQVVTNFNKERNEESFPPIDVGIGLNYGTLILGTVGEQHRMDTTVIADSVNLCSRLEGLSKHYGKGIIVPFEFLDLLLDPDVYHWRYLGLIRVQGRKQPVEVAHIYDGLAEQDFNLFHSTKDRFEEALHAYRNGEYEEAMNAFRTLAREVPDDPAIFTFITQIHRLMTSGLAENWDGVDTAEK